MQFTKASQVGGPIVIYVGSGGKRKKRIWDSRIFKLSSQKSIQNVTVKRVTLATIVSDEYS